MKHTNSLLIFFVSIAQAQEQQPITLFAHGVIDTGKQVYAYVKSYRDRKGKVHRNKKFIIEGPAATFNFPDAKWSVWKTDLGQQRDIQALSDAYKELITKYSNPIILMGLSRGASAIVTYVAQEKPKQVAALVLISPYDSIQGTIQDKYKKSWLRSFVHNIIRLGFHTYNFDGPHPIDVADQIPKDLPILIICSDQDSTVPAAGSLRLAQRLQDTGHTNVHVTRIKHGKHAKLLQGPDADLVKKAVDDFYAHYKLRS